MPGKNGRWDNDERSAGIHRFPELELQSEFSDRSFSRLSSMSDFDEYSEESPFDASFDSYTGSDTDALLSENEYEYEYDEDFQLYGNSSLNNLDDVRDYAYESGLFEDIEDYGVDSAARFSERANLVQNGRMDPALASELVKTVDEKQKQAHLAGVRTAGKLSEAHYAHLAYVDKDKTMKPALAIELRQQDRETKGIDHYARHALLAQLNTLKGAVNGLEAGYRTQKAAEFNQAYTATKWVKWKTPDATQSRLDAIATIKQVADSFNTFDAKNMKPLDSRVKIDFEVGQLKAAIATIHGAAMREYNKVDGDYRLMSAQNSAMHAVLKGTIVDTLSAEQQKGGLEAIASYDADKQRIEREEKSESTWTISV